MLELSCKSEKVMESLDSDLKSERKTSKLKCDIKPEEKIATKSGLSFLKGCFVDIALLKSDENYLVRPRLQCESFTAKTVEGKKMEEIMFIRKIIRDTTLKIT